VNFCWKSNRFSKRQLYWAIYKIHACSQQLLKLVSTILDPAKLEMNQIEGELNGFSSTLRVELLTPLSTIGYCEMLLEAPAALIPDLDSLNASAQQLLTLVNDIVSLAQQQLQILSTQQEAPLLFERSGCRVPSECHHDASDLSQESPKAGSERDDFTIDDSNPNLLARQLKRYGYTVTTDKYPTSPTAAGLR